MAPTWESDIRHLFTQYDRIKMLSYCDLGKYEDVKENANTLLLSVQPSQEGSMSMVGWSRLPNVHVMPKYGEPWTLNDGAKIELFKEWIGDGCPRGGPDPEPIPPDPLTPAFVALSIALTGFEDLAGDEEVTQKYLHRLQNPPSGANVVAGHTVSMVLESFEQKREAGLSDADAADDLVTSLGLDGAIRAIIRIWYTGAIEVTDPTDPTGEKILDFGTPGDNQYVHGLVWRAIQAHPMGYSTEDTKYWQNRPEPDGQFTGNPSHPQRP